MILKSYALQAIPRANIISRAGSWFWVNCDFSICFCFVLTLPCLFLSLQAVACLIESISIRASLWLQCLLLLAFLNFLSVSLHIPILFLFVSLGQLLLLRRNTLQILPKLPFPFFFSISIKKYHSYSYFIAASSSSSSSFSALPSFFFLLSPVQPY